MIFDMYQEEYDMKRKEVSAFHLPYIPQRYNKLAGKKKHLTLYPLGIFLSKADFFL